MYDTFEEIEIYSPEDVLNPIVLLLYNDFPKYYYQYFKKINKPENITSLAGIQIESNNPFFIESLVNQCTTEELKILQLDLNKPLKIKNTYFFTLFNIKEKDIVDFFTNYLLKNKKEKLIIVIFLCHPLTTINEFITNIDNQLINAKQHNCIMSVLNLLDY